MMFGSDGPAEQQQHSGGAGGGAGAGPAASGASEGERLQQQTPVPFSGGRKPTPRSVRIVSVQDSNAATSATGGAGGHRGEQQGTDRTTTTRVSSTAGVTTTSPSRTSSSFFCSLIWSRGGGAAKASAIGGLSPTTLLSYSQTPDARLRAAIATPPKFRSPGLHLETLRNPSFKTRIHFIYGLSSFSHMYPFRRFSISMRCIS